MTLRKATFLWLTASTLALIGALALILHLVISSTFSGLEREHAMRDMERARNALAQELAALDETAVDWAAWDDAREFLLRKGGHDFVESNLNDRTLASLRLSALAFLNRQGEPVWAHGFVPMQGTQAPLPRELSDEFTPGSPLLAANSVEDRVKGYMLLPQGPMLVVACPVTGSEGVGEPVGTLVMLRALGPQETAALAERVRLSLSIERADAPPSADVSQIAGTLTGGMALGPVSPERYCAVRILPDLWGRPALRLVLRDTREIMNLGDRAMLVSLAWMIGGAVLAFVALLAHLERHLLRRLRLLNEQVKNIGADADILLPELGSACPISVPLGRVDLHGSDELSALAMRINGAIRQLERSREGLATQCALTQEQESYLQQLLDSIQAGVILIDPDTRLIREVNAFAAASVGRTRDEIVGNLCHGFICPTAEGRCPVADLGKPGEHALGTLLRADGSQLPVLKSVSRIERSGKPLLLETFIDITDLQQAQEALKRSEESYRAIFMNTGTATMLVDPDTTIALVNQEFEKLSGFSKAEVEGRRRWTEFFVADDVEWMLQHHVRRRQSPELAPRNYEARFLTSRGDERVVRMTVGMIPETKVSVASIEDITERKKAEEQLLHQALHDGLTGLPNRQLLLDRLEHAIESARGEGHELAILLMDLDRFKDVNDSLGHGAGDRLLRIVAGRLREAVPRSDTVARLGGDEFIVVADCAHGRETGAQLAETLRAAFSAPFELDGETLHMDISVGIALFPAHGETPETLLKCADLAMYRAKEGGRSTYAFFTRELDEQVARRMTVEGWLRRALDTGGVEVFFQPKISQPGNRIAGAEALVRLRHPDGALIPPAEFIPVAENTGLIMPLSALVLREACRCATAWRTGPHQDFVMAVNLSPRQFQQPGLADRIRAILQETATPPEALEFEITENLLLDNRPETLETLSELRRMGAGIALDDFGKEYSSLSYIKKLPVQAIKIDRSFIDGLPGDEDDASIVKSVLSLAQGLELRVVAEGVETRAQLDFLVGLGCSEFQGYLFSKPLPAVDMQTLLGQSDPFPLP
ncbi:PAS domain S-box-containing protein/diguanylate cyclase (GGDEF) domain-containing protein [Humidesulfovibrio mexicanus]|uniref:PAS domain S-box-containing protein/diguanylate cyclase (GGDEF) domain-containing protein n=1 Tax=Humidesulfovibrio mexicanus TaxID=147047 RepID=A0A238Y9R7_9BACT|nr:EAL domain-containing protein [Humidesulfovibrio mexicanus]SNR67334.1 PAS domain S-box-containing protein/diguanylate cyclase (GGDEF) domain-containing protein [Humidesulfovibrio mexicanus]